MSAISTMRLLVFCVAALAYSATVAFGSTFVVVNTNDSGYGSLRWAIDSANATPNDANAPDEIDFNIFGDGVHTIVLASALPEITEPVIINGWSQPGWNGAPLMEMTAASGVTIDGLSITGGSTMVRGLVLNGFSYGVGISSNGNNIVQGCYIGTDNTGSVAVPNDTGISSNQTSNNLIGGVTAKERNIISGNSFAGVIFSDDQADVVGGGTTANVIEGNYIGLDVAGVHKIGNGQYGINAHGNSTQIGGLAPGAANVIAGTGYAIEQYGHYALIAGNLIGTDASGTVGIPNDGLGIHMQSAGGRILNNVVSSSAQGGMRIESWNGVVQGNFVGTDITGKRALPNGAAPNGYGYLAGIALIGVGNVIGGPAPGAGNVISGNGGSGIEMFADAYYQRNADRTVIEGNLIGTDISGTVALPNGRDGIAGSSGSENHIGGKDPRARNIISANAGNGISAGYGDWIEGNLIGLSSNGKALGNGGDGVRMADSAFTIVGSLAGPNLRSANTIVFNHGNGVTVMRTKTYSSTAGTGDRIAANSIHDNGLLGIDLGNDGVTPNDAGDADTGPNQLQDFPVISGAYASNGKVSIYGTLSSAANSSFTIEFFACRVPDSSGFGEGDMLLGQAAVTTDGTGSASFNATFALPSNVTAVTATATDAAGNTSEFSRANLITSSAPPQPSPTPTAVLPVGYTSQLLNISTRGLVGTDASVLIGGFIITGSESEKVLLRGIGPSLGSANVSGVLADPVIELHDSSGKLIAANDDWKTSQQAEIQTTGLAPRNDLESAVLQTLSPGSYTVILRGKNNTTGIGLVEAYDLSAGIATRLANISTRGYVDFGDNVLIGGFIVGRSGYGSTDVVVRALGRGISGQVPDALYDTTLELRDSNGALIKSNDDSSTLNDPEPDASILRDLGLTPPNYSDSAILATVSAGNYTAIVRGKNSTGNALVEIYDIGY